MCEQRKVLLYPHTEHNVVAARVRGVDVISTKGWEGNNNMSPIQSVIT